MIRYCPKCNREFEFSVKSKAELDSLICPNCGHSVATNNKKIFYAKSNDSIEKSIGKTEGTILVFTYLFCVVAAVMGIAAYAFECHSLLYGLTLVTLLFYFIQNQNKELGVLWITSGAIFGWLGCHTIAGVCLAIMVVLMIRHVVKVRFYESVVEKLFI